MMNTAAEALEVKEKQKPSFELSGKLAEETNKVGGITLLYSEPSEARKSDIRWRLYVFKGGEALNEPLYVHRMSHYLFGRERRIADVPTDHPSCSKQHAVLQYRLVEKEQPDGMMAQKVRPYLMDLGSTNGTFINENRIESHRYYELFERDNIKFGNSSREYVLLHENSTE
jgi:smad nuclear-interacting protein 1